MLLRRFFDDKLAQTSYLVACDHSRIGLIVDPNRDIEAYLDAARRDNIRIVAVTETHIHADFVSGSRELAKRSWRSALSVWRRRQGLGVRASRKATTPSC